MNVFPTLPLIVALLGQAPAPSPDQPDDPAHRLDFMKRSLAGFEIYAADARKTKYRFQPEPILRFTNPVGGAKDGALFFWLDDRDRPAVAVQVFRSQEGDWNQEFLSVATKPLVAESRSGPDWTPSRGGIDLRPLTGAPKPAATAEQRLAQMRTLVRDFAAEDDFRRRGWSALRLMSKPLARYGKPGTDVIDGALFCFALTTDPEVFLVLEARPGKDGPEWQYAFAPMTVFAVKGSWKGREVWSLPNRIENVQGRTETFHIRPIPAEE